jgi:hypothetical protein
MYIYTYIFLLTCHNFFAWGRLPQDFARAKSFLRTAMGQRHPQAQGLLGNLAKALCGGRKRNRLKSEIFSLTYFRTSIFSSLGRSGFSEGKVEQAWSQRKWKSKSKLFQHGNWLAENVAGELINTSLYGVLVLRVGPSLCLQSQPS